MTYYLDITSQSTIDTIKADLATITSFETSLEICNRNHDHTDDDGTLLTTALDNIPPNIKTLNLSGSRLEYYAKHVKKNLLPNIPSHITTLELSAGETFYYDNKFSLNYNLIPSSVTHLKIVHPRVSDSGNFVAMEKFFKSLPESIKEVSLNHWDLWEFEVHEQIALARSLSNVLKIHIVQDISHLKVRAYEKSRPTLTIPIVGKSVTPGIFKENIGNSLVEAHKQLMDIKDEAGSLILPNDVALEVLSFLTLKPYEVKALAEEQGQQKRQQEHCKLFTKTIAYSAGVVVSVATMYALM